MNFVGRLKERFRQDGWLLAMLIVSVGACLILGMTAPTPDAATDEELRLAQVLSSIDGAGQVDIAIFYGPEEALPCGAVVVAQGADDMAVRLRLTRAVSTLLGVEENCVEVFKRKEDR